MSLLIELECQLIPYVFLLTNREIKENDEESIEGEM